MKQIVAITSLILLIGQTASADAAPEPYQKITIKQVFSKLITRDKEDLVCCGQIRSRAGLSEFTRTYGVDIEGPDVDFEKQMLIFGITDDITTRAFQCLNQKKSGTYTLDYAETFIRYKLGGAGEGAKYSYLQVFVLKRPDVPHRVSVKNIIRTGVSKNYDTAPKRTSQVKSQ